MNQTKSNNLKHLDSNDIITTIKQQIKRNLISSNIWILMTLLQSCTKIEHGVSIADQSNCNLEQHININLIQEAN